MLGHTLEHHTHWDEKVLLLSLCLALLFGLMTSPAHAEAFSTAKPSGFVETPSTLTTQNLRVTKGAPHGAAIMPAQEDQFWVNEFGLPAIDGVVDCAAIWNGLLIIGGQFYQVGGIAATNIACWDGTKWAPLGTGIDEEVLSLIVYEGDLIAGGRFSRAGEMDTPGIARWNGYEWRALGSGLDSPTYDPPRVASLAVYRGELIAAGGFTHSGAAQLSRIARWDGQAWNPLGDGLSGPGYALAVLGDSLYAGGSFDHAGSQDVSSLAAWNSTTWNNVGGVTLGAGPGSVWALAVHQNALVVGGEFDSTGTVSARNVASWESGSWRALGEGIHARVTCLASYQGSIVAGVFFGSGGVHTWDGYSWSLAAPMDYGYALALLPAGSDLVVGGAFRANQVPEATVAGFNLARWTGSTWIGYETWNPHMRGLSRLFGGSPGIRTVCIHDSKIVAGGYIDLRGEPPNWLPCGMVAQWDGGGWDDLLPQSFTGQVRAVSSETDTLYAAGSFYPSFSLPFGMGGTQVLRYAGGTWSPMDTIGNSPTCFVRFQGALFLGTARGSSSAPYVTGLYRWDGSRWELIGEAESSDPFHGIQCMVVYDGKLVVGGNFDKMGGVPSSNIATWDGTQWGSLGTGLESDWFGVNGLAEWNGKLVAGGSFPFLPGGSSGAAIWNGNSWDRLGDLWGIAYALRNVRGDLYAGGWFGSVRQHLEGLLRFKGTSWEHIGTGVNGPVYAITELGDGLVIGGEFTRAGKYSSFGIAIWNGLGKGTSTAPRPLLSANRPNPFLSETRFSLDLPKAGTVRVSVHDALGREVSILSNVSLSTGHHEMFWNGHNAEGSSVTTGIYFIRAALPDGHVLSRKVLLVR